MVQRFGGALSLAVAALLYSRPSVAVHTREHAINGLLSLRQLSSCFHNVTIVVFFKNRHGGAVRTANSDHQNGILFHVSSQ